MRFNWPKLARLAKKTSRKIFSLFFVQVCSLLSKVIPFTIYLNSVTSSFQFNSNFIPAI